MNFHKTEENTYIKKTNRQHDRDEKIKTKALLEDELKALILSWKEEIEIQISKYETQTKTNQIHLEIESHFVQRL